MSKHEKFLIRLCIKPTPCDISWSELKSYLTHLGYKEKTGGGSRRKFIHAERKLVISLHEPHPASVIKAYAVVEVITHLKQAGFIK